MEILRIISLFILIIGLVFLMAELVTEEVEFFAPMAIFTIIVGLIVFFLSDPKEWFRISDIFYVYFVLIILIIGIISIVFSLFILNKIRLIKNKPPELLDFIGKDVKVISPINSAQKGYVLFHGEKWNAISSDLLQEGEKAIIESANIDGLTLIVKKSPSQPQPSKRSSKKRKIENYQSKLKKCPECSNEIDTSYQICPYCGLELKS